ncbi:hypothetical protein QJS66_11815 [Kocuria rhizophila]|nr:hypothetical protein QJS66_11815 [Kocuria rhizophila]
MSVRGGEPGGIGCAEAAVGAGHRPGGAGPRAPGRAGTAGG